MMREKEREREIDERERDRYGGLTKWVLHIEKHIPHYRGAGPPFFKTMSIQSASRITLWNMKVGSFRSMRLFDS